MAVASPARFCGRCGAPLAPGAGFCGRCGTPVLMAAAAPPMYTYAPAPFAAYPAPRTRLGPVLIAGGLIAVLLIVGLIVGGIAVSQFARGGGAPPTCTSNCPPKFVSPLPEEASFTSSAYGFTVNYSSRWTVRDQNAQGVAIGTRLGLVTVIGSRNQSPDQAIQAAVAALPTDKYQDVTTFTPVVRGAHLGDVQGSGAIYSANLLGGSQTAAKVRIALIAGAKGGVTVLVMAVEPYDAKSTPNGITESQSIDYLCTEFVWAGEK